MAEIDRTGVIVRIFDSKRRASNNYMAATKCAAILAKF